MPKAKRKIETVDLTQDSDAEEPPYRSKLAKSSQNTSLSSSQGQVQRRPVYATPPSSSQSAPIDTFGSLSQSSRVAPLGSQVHSHSERESWTALQERNFDDEIRREIDLTQDDDDEDAYENRQLYGILDTKIVGVRYYNGRATVGEYVIIRREPGNPYDRNAIRIDNVMHSQIGHIGRQVAAKLAPLMDSGEIVLEGALTGIKSDFDCPIGLKMFGTTDPVQAGVLKQKMQGLRLPVNELNKAEVERNKRAKAMEQQQKAREKAAAAMRKGGNKVYDAAAGSNKYSNLGGPGSGIPENNIDMRQLLGDTASFNPREAKDAMNKFATGEDVLAKMKMTDQPETLSTVLLPYQRQGLQWMLEHESPKPPARNSDEVIQLWKNNHGIYSNIATGFSITNGPELASGGILADDMGLGKTIQIIALIMSDLVQNKQPTLIIAPLSVMSNWRDQAKQHVKKKFAPKVLIYHGQENRGLAPQEFQQYDIVVTTYQTMTMELFPNRSKEKDKPVNLPAAKGLFSVKWRRVVLDEGHQIRNPKAKMARAACSLMAKSRWVLTGTPIVNSLKDLYSHVKFLKLSGGLMEFEIFNANVMRPLKSGDPSARILLRALMQSLCLRRMKDMKFIDLKLPELAFHKYLIKFLEHEQERYDAFKAEAVGLVESAKVKKGDNTMTHLLEVLLRLRQTCNHWRMCGEERVKKLMALLEENKVVDIMDPANRKALQDLLQLNIDSQEDCPVCIDSMTNPVITACGHAFCRDCIEKVIETQHKCPMCRSDLQTIDSLIRPAANFGEAEAEVLNQINADESSSKIEALVRLLQASSSEPDTKTVVFSQWTSFLDLVQAQLLEHDLSYTRLDGKMTALHRDAAIESLNTDPNYKIMLASLSVCSVGLNLVAANQVILADSWWAPAIEDQAVDRVHRLGQTRNCKVVRLVVEGTIEDEVLEIQARKRKLAGMAFGEKGEGRRRTEQRAGTLGDIERLLGRST